MLIDSFSITQKQLYQHIWYVFRVPVERIALAAKEELVSCCERRGLFLFICLMHYSMSWRPWIPRLGQANKPGTKQVPFESSRYDIKVIWNDSWQDVWYQEWIEMVIVRSDAVGTRRETVQGNCLLHSTLPPEQCQGTLEPSSITYLLPWRRKRVFLTLSAYIILKNVFVPSVVSRVKNTSPVNGMNKVCVALDVEPTHNQTGQETWSLGDLSVFSWR